MKLSLDTVSYCGYFTDGEHVPIEEAMNRAAKFGYDAIDVVGKPAQAPAADSLFFDQG